MKGVTQTMRVRIVKCWNNEWWYNDIIGSEIEVAESGSLLFHKNEYFESVGISPKGYILKSDCEIITEEKETMKTEFDPVNRPAHYADSKIETIDFIEDKKLNYHLGNCVKYISRAGKKDPNKTIEDLQKAAWYLNREIERLKDPIGYKTN